MADLTLLVDHRSTDIRRLLTDGYQDCAASRTDPPRCDCHHRPQTSPAILRYTAFTDTPDGGNPAGVVLDARALRRRADAARSPAELGYSESAFVDQRERRRLRRPLLQPARPRCRSAGTRRSPPASRWPSATAPGRSTFHTQAGEVPVAHAESDGARHRDADERRARTSSEPAGRLLDARARRARLERRTTSTRRSRRRSPTPAPAT